MSKAYDSVVIGAGVFGAWTAWHLLRAGQRVLLIDKYGPASTRASSGGETRVIRMAYGPDEIYTRMSQQSLLIWKDFFARIARPELFRETGVLWLADADAAAAKSSLDVLASNGVRHDVLDGNMLARRYPQIAIPPGGWAIFEPDSGALLARRAVQAVVEDNLCRGAELRIATVVTPQGDGHLTQIKTETGDTVCADRFVFACGPWLGGVLPNVLGGRIFPTRQEIFYFGIAAGDRQFSAPALPIWLDFGRDYYGMPDIDGRGFKIAHDAHGEAIDPDTMERAPSATRIGVSRATFSRAGKRAATRRRSLPVRKHQQRRLRHRPSSDFRQRLDRRWRLWPWLQARTGGRRVSGRTNAARRAGRTAFQSRYETSDAEARGALIRNKSSSM
jgi:glycine/D-amino acid oxidase-like deaminating enzyme